MGAIVWLHTGDPSYLHGLLVSLLFFRKELKMLTCFELTFLGLGMILGLLRSCEALVNEGSLRSVHPVSGLSFLGWALYVP